MRVKELIEQLLRFDGEHPVVIKENCPNCGEFENTIKEVVWEFDGCCKIILA